MRANRYSIGIVLLCLLAAACRKGPEHDVVASQIQAKLDRNFKAGFFKVVGLQRKGHYAYREEGNGGNGERLLVYYNAELEVLKDYRLSDWDKPNVGSLISVLGAKPDGVRGVKPEGNKKGDRITVRGASAYAKKGAGWRPVAFLPAARAKAQEQTTDKNLLPYRRSLKRLGELGVAFQKSKDKVDLEALTDQLAGARDVAERMLGRREGWLTLASGNRSGEYYRQARALQGVLKRAGHEARGFASSGSVENCRLVARKEVLFGYSQNDIAQMEHSGTGLFDTQVPLSNLRALCSLYPEAVQIVTLKTSGLKGLRDLRGKRVNIGERESGVRGNAVQVLQEAGLSLGDFAEVRDGPLSRAMQELQDGRIDALFFTSAYPNQALYKMADKTPIDLIPLGRRTVRRLKAKHPYLIPLEVPANTYPSVKGKRLTVQVTAMLITHKDAPAAKIRTLLTELFANVPTLSKGSLQAYFISKRTALSGVSIPLHPAAKAFFQK